MRADRSGPSKKINRPRRRGRDLAAARPGPPPAGPVRQLPRL